MQKPKILLAKIGSLGDLHPFMAIALALQRRGYDPPQTPEFRILKGGPADALGAGWNRFIYKLIRRALRRRYAARIDTVRAAHGLAPSTAALLLDPGNLPALTLGSIVIHAAGDFYAQAAQAAARLGMRAVLLTGQPDGAIRSSGDILVRAYAPHSALFPRTAVVIHHGGIGTTGLSLRAGRPQLVVPHMSDQFDNARRIERLGVGARLTARRFTPERAQAGLSRLLKEKTYQTQAARIGAIVQAETEAQTAALAIEQAIARHGGSCDAGSP